MTYFLLACWVVSLLVLIGILIFARMGRGVIEVPREDIPNDFRDFLAFELNRIGGHLLGGARRLRPHGERAIATSQVLFKKGHNMFIEKVVGRIEVKRGKAASFFLKRIAEHKEALRQKSREEL